MDHTLSFRVDYYDRKTKLFTPYSSKNVKGLEGNNWVSKEDGNGNLYIGHHLRGLSIVSLKDRTAKIISMTPIILIAFPIMKYALYA